MFCPYCGKDNQGSTSKCRGCGADLTKIISTIEVKDNPEMLTEMKWHNFLVKFLLYASSIIYFLDGITSLIGRDSAFLSEFLADDFAFTGKFRFIDIIYGVIMIILSFATLHVRHKLANFKVDALRYYIIHAVIECIVFAVHTLLGMVLITHSGIFEIIGEIFGSIVGTVFFVTTNISYFKKRKYLFVNK